jgi:polysaccharide biosynthesis transport protein
MNHSSKEVSELMLPDPILQLESADKSAAPAVYATYEIPGQAAPGDQVDISHLTSQLWARKGLIALAGVLGILAGLGMAQISKPMFRARTTLQVEAFNDSPLMREITPVSSVVPNATADNYLQNEVKVLESRTLAVKVADGLGVTPPPPSKDWLTVTMGSVKKFVAGSEEISPEERRVEVVQQALSVRTSLQSQVVELFYDDKDPAFAARAANTAAGTFIEMNREARAQLVQDTTEWLNKQVAELKAKLEGYTRQLQDFARSSGLIFAGKTNTLAEDRMRQIQDSLARAEVDRASKQSHYETAASDSKSLLTDPASNGPLRQYEIDLQTMKREMAQLQTIYTPTHYKVQKLEAQIAETEAAIEKERTELLGRLRTEYIASASLERMLTAEQERQLKAVEQQMDNERSYNLIKGEMETTQRLYESMLQKVKEAGAARSLRTTNIRVIDPASVPVAPYSPRPVLNAAIGLVCGLAFGIGLVFVRPPSDKVRRPGEFALANVPELGAIPSARDAWALERHGLVRFRPNAPNLALVAWERESSLLTESFRAALSSILFSDRSAGRRQVLVVASMNVMDGKTTVAANLAIASAERNRRVLLIDADLRRPRLHEVFDVPNDRGLSDLLQRSSRLEGSTLGNPVQPTTIPNLWILPSGPAANAKLLYSSDLTGLLQRLREEFDLIFIDTPPLVPYSDGRVLGRASDGMVLVVRANASSRDELRSVHARLVHDRIPLVGTILNDWKMDPDQVRSYSKYYLHYSALRKG